jgi:hypothetical protein
MARAFKVGSATERAGARLARARHLLAVDPAGAAREAEGALELIPPAVLPTLRLVACQILLSAGQPRSEEAAILADLNGQLPPGQDPRPAEEWARLPLP